MNNNNQIEKIRHSLSHILAAAVKDIYEDVKLGIGPTIENGFYYDFVVTKQHETKKHENEHETQTNISKEDLPKIEKKMEEIINKDLSFEQEKMGIKQAKEFFEDKGEPYKVELIKELEGEGEDEVSIYRTGSEFVDLCSGPHVQNTEEIDPKGFKLTKTAGAYWRGDEENTQMQRIYGVAFKNKEKLEEYEEKKKEAEKRDHRKLAKKLDLFHIDEEVGPGLILWHPKGAFIKRKVSQFVLDKYLDENYKLVNTPHIADLDLWQKSGHTDFYAEDMYPPMNAEKENRKYQLKPMNCPFHMQIYKSDVRSYRDLPLKYTELGTVYRQEKSGVTQGLTRTRGFTQDDAHVFCRPDQLETELTKLLNLTEEILTTFNFDEYEINLSIRDPEHKENYLGKDKRWKLAEDSLKKALKEKEWKYKQEEGEAAFYGPKIDIDVTDAIGRSWQISTIQVDFNLPKRFDIHYRNENSKKEEPMIVHRALLGSVERFLGVYIEHCAGEFPVWLAPIQARIIPISDDNLDYAQEVKERMEKENLRVEIDQSDETLSKKIRNGELQKIPYLLVVGGNEEEAGTVNIRDRDKGTEEEIDTDKFIKKLKDEEAQKKQ